MRTTWTPFHDSFDIIYQCLFYFFYMNSVFSFPTQCHTAGRWQVNQYFGPKWFGLSLFFECLRARFFCSICTLWKNYYKQLVFYRAKTITKINDRNLTAICLANVSFRDGFLFLSIVIFLLFILSILWCSTKYSIISFIRIGSLLLFLLIEFSDIVLCVCVYNVLTWLMVFTVCSVHSSNSWNTSHCSLVWWIFFWPFALV